MSVIFLKHLEITSYLEFLSFKDGGRKVKDKLDDKLLKYVYRKNYDKIKKIVDKGANINAVDEEGRNALIHALLESEGEIEMIDFLISLGADYKISDKEGWTALHYVARDQKEELVNKLLEYDVNIDAVDSYGNTPLWRCVMNKTPNINIVRALLKKGANPNKKNNHDVSPKDIVSNSDDKTGLDKKIIELFESAH